VPIYEYVCDACGHVAELMQKVSDPPPAACPACGAGPLSKLVSRTSFHLKGGGWYADLYASKKDAGAAPAPDAKAGGKAEAKAGAEGEAKGAAKAEPKGEAKAEAKSEPRPASAPSAAGGGAAGPGKAGGGTPPAG
jgi:putative FmdB family regulatory protein